MQLYNIIILSSIVFICTGNAFLSIPVYKFTMYEIIFGVIANTFAVFVIDAIIATVIHSLPRKFMNPYKKIYRVNKFEKSFYDKIRIHKWKDRIPETGKYLCNFGKEKVKDINDSAYIYKFLQETCYAESMHFISAFIGYLIIFIYPVKFMWCYGFPVATVNFFLQLLPAFVQRYNRPKLLRIYESNLKKQSLTAAVTK